MDYNTEQAQHSTDRLERSALPLDDQQTPISIDFGSLTLSPLTLPENLENSDNRPVVDVQLSNMSTKANRLPPATHPGTTFSTPSFLRRRSLAPSSYLSRPSASLPRGKSFKTSDLNKPLPVLRTTPSYMQITPSHLRRPGVSNGHNTTASKQQRENDKRSSFLPKFNVQPSSPRTSFSMFHGKSQNAALKRAKSITHAANIAVAVRVRPVPTSTIDSKLVPTYLLTSNSSRPCLLIENNNDHRKPNGSIRKRPQNAFEKFDNQSPSASPVDARETYATSSKNIFVTVPQATQGGIPFMNTTRGFSSFDYVFSDLTTQQHLYSSCVAPLIARFLDSGIDVSLIAYGQTNSGKSYTLGTAGILDGTLDGTLDFGGKFSEEVFQRMCRDSSGVKQVDKSRDGILIRALNDIFGKTAISSRSVAVSYVEIGTRSAPAGLEETVFDLFQNQMVSDNDANAERFWGALAKVPVTSTEEVIRTLLKATGNRSPKGLAEAGGHMLIGIEVGNETEEKSRLVFVDLFGSDKLAQLTGNSEIPNDVRFLSTQNLIFATVSAQPIDATETLATLLLAERAKHGQNTEKENQLKLTSSIRRGGKNDSGRRSERRSKFQISQKSAHEGEEIAELRSRIQELENENSRLKREPVSSKVLNAADRDEQKSIEQINANGDYQQLQSDVSMLRNLLRGERLSFSHLEHRLADAQSDLTLAQQAMERAVESERSTRLDLGALKGSLISMTRERDAGQMELRKSKACEDAARDKWFASENECQILKLVIADMEQSIDMEHAHRQASPSSKLDLSDLSLPTEGSSTTLNADKPFVDILTDLTNRLARSQQLTEKLQKVLDEQQAISAKVERKAKKEQRLKEKLMVKLELLIVRAGHMDGITEDLNDDGDEEAESPYESTSLLSGTAWSKISSIYRRVSDSEPSEEYLNMLDSRIIASAAGPDAQIISSDLLTMPTDGMDMQTKAQESSSEDLEAEAEWDALAVQLERDDLDSQQRTDDRNM